MAKLTEGITGGRGPTEPGDMLCYTGRWEKTGATKDVQLVRTDRPYNHDLADAYNQTLPSGSEYAWFPDGNGGLRFDLTPQAEAKRRAALKATIAAESNRP